MHKRAHQYQTVREERSKQNPTFQARRNRSSADILTNIVRLRRAAKVALCDKQMAHTGLCMMLLQMLHRELFIQIVKGREHFA